MQQDEPGDGPAAPVADWRLVAIATLAVFAIYAVSVWARTLPVISQDELGFIAQSQLLAGVSAVNMGSAPYYHPGYSLLLVPVWWISHDPVLVYKGFVLINALLAALVVPLLADMAARLGFGRKPLILAAAAIVALWPSCFFVAHYAWSEALFRLLLAVHVWALLRLVRRPGAGWGMLFGLSATALYAVHPKALLLLPAAPAVLVALRLMRVLGTRALALVLVAFVLATAGAMLAMNALHGRLWHEGGYSTARALLGGLLRPEALPTGLTVLLGQLWYQLAASLGLVALGAWFILRRVTARGPPALRLAAGYLLLAAVAVGLASVGQMLDPQRIDHVAYGRYVDGASLPVLWLGLCWLLFAKRGEGQALAGIAGICGILAGGAILAVLPTLSGLEPAHPENVAGIGWVFRTGSTPLQFFGINSVLVGVAAGLLLLLNRAGRLAVAGVFVIGASVVISAYMASQSRVQLELLSADAAAIRREAVEPLYWTEEVRDRKLWSYHLQYVLSTSFIDAEDTLPAGAGLISAEPAADGLVCAAALTDGLYLLANPPHDRGC